MYPADVIVDLTAVEILGLYRSGQLSPIEVAGAFLDQIRTHNEQVNAFCLIDEGVTMEEARKSEERYSRMSPLGLLDGIPVAIKDVFLTRGWPNLKGSKTIDPKGPWNEDAPAVAALKRHGAVPMGKTTTPEFGWKGVTDNPLTGVTSNPWDPATTAGGSSGGSAAAVAGRMAPLALGTDAGGSIRIPAGFCGIVGFKPTQGRCPMYPPSPFGQLAHVGPMTWTVDDCALLMEVLSEADSRDATLPSPSEPLMPDPVAGFRGLRVAFSPRMGYVKINDPEIEAAVTRAAHIFEECGAIVEEVDPGFDDPREPFERLFYGGAAKAVSGVPKKDRKKMDQALVHMGEEYAKMPVLDYFDAMAARDALKVQTGHFHEKYDILLTPSLPIPAFKAGQEVPDGWKEERWHTWTPYTYPFNVTGQPAISVPCGFTDEGLPISLQLVGARHEDKLVLQTAHIYQQLDGYTQYRPEF